MVADSILPAPGYSGKMLSAWPGDEIGCRGMEITCTRCHQAVLPGASYCPACGLPQLIFTEDGSLDQTQALPWNAAVRDAGSIEWKPAMRAVLLVAIPSGLICSLLSPAGILGLLWMTGAAAAVVVLYMRNRRPAWLTLGAGARLGLVTGILSGGTAAAATGSALFVLRFVLHKGSIFDNFWQSLVTEQISQQWATMGVDAPTITLAKTWLLSPEGRAAWVLCVLAFLMGAMALFAAAGGALGARWIARSRRTSV